MWPFKKKQIKETKYYPYRGRVDNSNFSSWDSMSIIEKFAIIVLPCMMLFMIYTMLDMWILLWWIKLIISIGVIVLLGIIIFIIADWLSRSG